MAAVVGLLALVIGVVVPGELRGEESESEASPWELGVGGYGTVAFEWRGYGPDPTRGGGSRADSRLVFDSTRLALEVEGSLPGDVAFESEVEFEHGGTGSAMELEYEEFGEYEREVEQGGEVVVEELFLEKTFGERFRLRAGSFYVGIGLLPNHYEPSSFAGAGRPEMATTMLPGVWNEMGVSAAGEFGPVEATLQLVNGLDSTGFSSQYWIAGGHQGRFEEVRASGLAGVGRVDVSFGDGWTVGASGYHGGTSANRPKADLAAACDGDDQNNQDRRAPCGYVNAPVTLASLHATADLEYVRGRAMALWGYLDNAQAVSERNKSLSNRLNVLRSAVAEQALGGWTEIGLRLGRIFEWPAAHEVEPYARFEFYDTQFDPRGSIEDNPRFERYILGAGVGYRYMDRVISKLGWRQRRFGSDDLHVENAVVLTQSFEF